VKTCFFIPVLSDVPSKSKLYTSISLLAEEIAIIKHLNYSPHVFIVAHKMEYGKLAQKCFFSHRIAITVIYQSNACKSTALQSALKWASNESMEIFMMLDSSDDFCLRRGTVMNVLDALKLSKVRFGLPVVSGAAFDTLRNPSKKLNYIEDQYRTIFSMQYCKRFESPTVAYQCMAFFLHDLNGFPNIKGASDDIWINCFFISKSLAITNKPKGYSPIVKPLSARVFFEPPRTVAMWEKRCLRMSLGFLNAISSFPKEHEELCVYFRAPFALNCGSRTDLHGFGLSLGMRIRGQLLQRRIAMIEQKARVIIEQNEYSHTLAKEVPES